MPANDWMSAINDLRLLSEMTMPGSHDAGINTGDTDRRTVAPKRFAITQDVGIRQQCDRGSRFFDIRINASSGRTYHGNFVLGALGQSLDDILRDVRGFLVANAGECVILRFTKTEGNLDVILNRIQAVLGPGPGGQIDLLFRHNRNLALEPMRNLRHKAICVFEETHQAIIPEVGLHRFSRYDPAVPAAAGLAACGKYSERTNLSEVINRQVTKIDEHANHRPNDHLFVLYWTQTGSGLSRNIKDFSMKTRNLQKEQQKRRVTGGAYHNMDYLKNLVTRGTDARSQQQKTRVLVTTAADRRKIMPNVIMYDFVNTAMSDEIVTLNNPALRGHVVEDEYDGVMGLFEEAS